MNMLNFKYYKALDNFRDTLSHYYNLHLPAILVQIRNGRKFDKIITATIRDDLTWETLFFIDHEDGTIYGVKNDTTPNLHHWYGTIYTYENWDWTPGQQPKPIDPESVVVMTGYGVWKHYGPKVVEKTLEGQLVPLAESDLE